MRNTPKFSFILGSPQRERQKGCGTLHTRDEKPHGASMLHRRPTFVPLEYGQYSPYSTFKIVTSLHFLQLLPNLHALMHSADSLVIRSEAAVSAALLESRRAW